jgi:hypothetical protein
MNPDSPGPELPPSDPAGLPTPGGGPVPPGPEPGAPADPTPPGPTPAGPTAGPANSGPGPAASWGAWTWGGSPAREARRAERRAQREARRAERGIGSAIWGVLLVLIGAGILASELLPGFDWDAAWPTVLVAFGILLIAASIRRAPAGP